MVELVVLALLLQQVVVAAPLHHLAVLQHQYGVGVADCAQPVGDGKDGPSLHELVHALFDEGLGTGVDGGGGFVQDEHRRVGHGSPGDCQQLPLALGQVGAVGGDHGVIALRQAADEGVGVGDAGGGLNLLHGGVQLAKADVIGDGAGEEVGVLEDHAQGAAQVVLSDVLHVDAVIGHLSLLDVVESVDEVGDGGLAGAGGAHESDLLAGLGKEADVLENGVLRLVAKRDILEADIPPEGHRGAIRFLPRPACPLSRQGHTAFIYLGRLVHGFKDPLRTGQSS